MTEVKYRNALSLLGADDVNHHGRKLTEHLIGTYSLLLKWGNSPKVAAAGAFHSIYGTEEFKTRAISLNRRAEIAALIGNEAETLAYLFGVSDRRRFYEVKDGEKPFVTIPAEGNATLEITEEQYRSLLEIEVANIVEQAMHQTGVPDTVIRFWINAFEAKHMCLSKGAAVESKAVLEKALVRNAT